MATPRVEFSEVSDDNLAPQPQRWGKIALAVGGACALLLVGVAAGSHFGSSQAFSKVVAPIGLNSIEVIPPREQCAKLSQDCRAQQCCQLTGYRCYGAKAGAAKCMKDCVPGKDGSCELIAPAWKPSAKSTVSYSANTLFCFSFYTADTGSTKPSFELELLRTQLFLGASIFGCEEKRVYSDVDTWISPKGINTIKVDDVEGNFHFDKRKRVGSWINSNMFIQAWKAIKEEGVWAKYDWTVKADIDAVFIPIRLRDYLGQVEVTKNGIYLESCKYVNYGFFGSLAVVSHDAAGTYMTNIDDCKSALNYMGKEKDAGFQPWGEDLFQQRCMDLHGVDKVAAYDLNTDAACAMWRPESEKKNRKWRPDCAVTKTPAMHMFKKPEEYFKCLKATQGQ